MSDSNAPKENKGFGVFIKSKAKPAAPAGLAGLTKPKDVKKRWMYVGAGLAVALMVVSAMMKKDDPVRPQSAKKEEAVIDVTPKDEDKKAFTARYGYDLEEVKRRVAQTESESKAKDDAIKDLRDKVDKGAPQKLIQTIRGVGYVIRENT